MSRSGYDGDCDGWALIRWRGAVTSAIRGKRGQAFLREMVAALDDLPEKILIDDELGADGEYCALGAVGAARGLDMSKIDYMDSDEVAGAFGIAAALVREISGENDDRYFWGRRETKEERWTRMCKWAVRHIDYDVVVRI